MFQVFTAWFNDPLVQSLLISPFVGAVFGALFAGLNSPPSPAAPVTVHQTVVIFKQTIVVNQNGRKSSSQDDGAAYLIAMGLLIAGITWGYSRYSTEILGYWLSGLFSATAFILSAGIASAIRGHYSNAEWAWYIFAPIVAVGFSFYLVHLAQLAIIPGAREAAQNQGFVDFYMKTLREEHRTWLLLQIGGVLFGVLATLAATLRSVHYLALMNQRATGNFTSIWHSLARMTWFSAHTGGIVLLLFAAAVSYLALSGSAYEFLRTRG